MKGAYSTLLQIMLKCNYMKSFIDVVEERFFYPLANRSKYLYEIVIFNLFEWVDELDEADENDRKIIENRLSELLDQRLQSDIYFDNDELFKGSSLQKAQAILRYLIDCKWIFEESKGNGLYSINFYDYSYDMITMMNKVRNSESKSYDSEIRRIIRTLADFQMNRYEDLKDITDSINSLSTMLKSLRSNINKYYANILTNKTNVELKHIIKDLSEYQIDFFDKAYYRFKMEEASNNNINYIIKELEKILDKELNSFLESFSKHEDYVNDEPLFHLEKKIKESISSLKSLKTVIKNIDEKNNRYVNALIDKIYYLINRGSDIKGILNKAVYYTVNDKIKNYDYLKIYDQFHYAWEKLYKPLKKRDKLETVFKKQLRLLSEEDREKALKQFEEGLEFSIERINEYVLNLLEGKENIIASNIKFYQENDYIRLILIPVYAFLSETDYKIKLLNEKGYIDNIEFDNFIIQRRQRT